MYVVGYSGSGKTEWTLRETLADRWLLVWDSKGEADPWGTSRGRCHVCTSLSALSQLIKPDSSPRRIAVRVPVTRENFDVFCRLAWVYIRSHGGTLIAEELADVSTPGKAPIAWGEICRKTRDFGSWVYALTQRPQEVDNTAQGNASFFHCGMMADTSDAAYVARRLLCISPAEVEALQPLEWIERDVRSRTITRGKVPIGRRR